MVGPGYRQAGVVIYQKKRVYDAFWDHCLEALRWVVGAGVLGRTK